ncbi:MAG TPA: HAD hydrolase family protein [Syntrophorhabdaceae bacterium]|jgi:3-deoxy-D-manno-octulosonate 8-phosphate phosphatase (KDO 8-P phosphatase)
MAKADAMEKAGKVKFVVLDIHGVLTDNTLYYTQEGTKSEAFSLHDRMGVKALLESGIGVSFLTTKVSRADEQMAKIYGIPPEMLWSSGAKMARLDEFEQASGYKDEDICYVGDEMIDLGIMGRAGFSAAPSDGSLEARSVADYVTKAGGGRGVVRELAQYILEAQGRWDAFMEKFK